jgi:Uncharacterized protein conserved in bacteria
MGTKVLELSPFEDSVSASVYPDAEVTRWDFVSPIPPEFVGQFDAVMANNALQRFNYMASITALAAWAQCLKEGGELHVVVPSLEWACREVLSENPSPVCMIVLYGGQGGDGSIHTSGYTMRLLRAHFDKIGLGVTKARTGDVDIEVNGKVMKFQQHYICGVKGVPELSKQ